METGTVIPLAPTPQDKRQPAKTAERIRRTPIISFHRRMLAKRPYSLVVTIEDPARAGAAPVDPEGRYAASVPGVLVRPVLPNALVTPALAEVSAHHGSEARFWVLPFASGKWKDARIEFRTPSRPAGTEKLPMKVRTRKLSWFMILLTIVVTAWIAYDRRDPEPWEPAGYLPAGHFQAAENAEAADERSNGEDSTAKKGRPANPLANALGMFQAGARAEESSRRRNLIPYRGTQYFEKYIPATAEQLLTKPVSTWEVEDFAVVGMSYVKPALVYAYEGRELVRNITLAEVLVGGPLLGLTIIVWVLQGPRRARRRGTVLELTA